MGMQGRHSLHRAFRFSLNLLTFGDRVKPPMQEREDTDRVGPPKPALELPCANYSAPRALPASFLLPHFQGTTVKVTTFPPEWGSVCSGGPLKTAVSWGCWKRVRPQRGSEVAVGGGGAAEA